MFYTASMFLSSVWHIATSCEFTPVYRIPRVIFLDITEFEVGPVYKDRPSLIRFESFQNEKNSFTSTAGAMLALHRSLQVTR
jgi:hypothetical protein